jgi:hypothetical protein
VKHQNSGFSIDYSKMLNGLNPKKKQQKRLHYINVNVTDRSPEDAHPLPYEPYWGQGMRILWKTISDTDVKFVFAFIVVIRRETSKFRVLDWL